MKEMPAQTRATMALWTMLIFLIWQCISSPCNSEDGSANLDWNAPNQFPIKSYPCILGAFERTNTPIGDQLFSAAKFELAAEKYQEIVRKGVKNNDERGTILAKEAWALCLAKKYREALATVDSSMRLVGDKSDYYWSGLEPLKAQIYADSGDYSMVAQFLRQNYYRRPSDNLAKSYLASLLLSRQPSEFALEKKRVIDALPKGFLNIGPKIFCKCTTVSKELYRGLCCSFTSEEAISHWHSSELSKSNLPNLKFDPNQWKAISEPESTYRLSSLYDFLTEHSPLGLTKQEIRRELGPRSFVTTSTIYEDFFPVCIQRTRKLGSHDRYFSKPGVVDNPNAGDMLWMLKITYNDAGRAAALEFCRLDFMCMVRGVIRTL